MLENGTYIPPHSDYMIFLVDLHTILPDTYKISREYLHNECKSCIFLCDKFVCELASQIHPCVSPIVHVILSFLLIFYIILIIVLP